MAKLTVHQRQYLERLKSEDGWVSFGGNAYRSLDGLRQRGLIEMERAQAPNGFSVAYKARLTDKGKSA